MNDRVTELEIKVAHLEADLNALNDALIRQDAVLEALDAQIERLQDRLDSAGDLPEDTDPEAEKPPHY